VGSYVCCVCSVFCVCIVNVLCVECPVCCVLCVWCYVCWVSCVLGVVLVCSSFFVLCPVFSLCVVCIVLCALCLLCLLCTLFVYCVWVCFVCVGVCAVDRMKSSRVTSLSPPPTSSTRGWRWRWCAGFCSGAPLASSRAICSRICCPPVISLCQTVFRCVCVFVFLVRLYVCVKTPTDAHTLPFRRTHTLSFYTHTHLL